MLLIVILVDNRLIYIVRSRVTRYGCSTTDASGSRDRKCTYSSFRQSGYYRPRFHVCRQNFKQNNNSTICSFFVKLWIDWSTHQ